MEHAYFFGIFVEPRDRLFDLVEDGMVIFDVGANFGETSLYMSKINPHGKVCAFEPLPEAFQKLKKNKELNSLENCYLYSLALSNKSEDLAIHLTGVQNSGSTFLKPVSDKSEQVAKAVTLDQMADSESGCDLIKIDVEGFEKKVLEGAEKTLRKFRPVLFIEIDQNNLMRQNTSAASTIEYIRGFDYSVHYADDLETINVEEDLKYDHFDVICRPN
jgi:FkbM family methyltransferase